MSKHTPGPWKTYISERDVNAPLIWSEHDGKINSVASTDGGKEEMQVKRANAARIVACVNACEGIESPEAIRDLIQLSLEAAPGMRNTNALRARQFETVLARLGVK